MDMKPQINLAINLFLLAVALFGAGLYSGFALVISWNPPSNFGLEGILLFVLMYAACGVGIFLSIWNIRKIAREGWK